MKKYGTHKGSAKGGSGGHPPMKTVNDVPIKKGREYGDAGRAGTQDSHYGGTNSNE